MSFVIWLVFLSNSRFVGNLMRAASHVILKRPSSAYRACWRKFKPALPISTDLSKVHVRHLVHREHVYRGPILEFENQITSDALIDFIVFIVWLNF
jgi:hypothetical protein